MATKKASDGNVNKEAYLIRARAI